MKDPKSLQHSGNSLKTLIHGDLWHNNIYFGKFPEERKVILSGWQMAHFGSAANGESTNMPFITEDYKNTSCYFQW